MADGDQITAEEWAVWMHPQDAIRLVSKGMQHDWSIAATSIIRRLRLGKLRAHFESGIVQRAGKKHILKPYAAIPAAVVENWAKSNHLSQLPFWVSGEAETITRTGFSHQDPENHWMLLGIRFERAGIEALVPGSAPPSVPITPEVVARPPASAAPAKHAGGAPPKGIWERVWIEIAARLIRGEFDPQKQKDIEDPILYFPYAEANDSRTSRFPE